MARKRNVKHPSFLIGLLSFVLFLLEVVLRGNGFLQGAFVILSAIVLGAIHWIWGVIDVIMEYDLMPESKTFWLILVMLVPPVGGIIYYLMKQKNISM